MSKSTENALPTNWAALLDELKNKESLTSDAKLAETLGVTRGYICSVKKGRKNVSLDLAKKIFSRLGRTYETRDLERLFVPTKVRQYTSNLSAIRREVILRAKGSCQLCGMTAPFQDPDGLPYLEVHHIKPAVEEGSDTLCNLVALCPNCHKKINLNPSQQDKKKLEDLAQECSAQS